MLGGDEIDEFGGFVAGARVEASEGEVEGADEEVFGKVDMNGVPAVVVKDVEMVCDVVGCNFDVLVWAVCSAWSSDVWPEAAVDEWMLDGVVGVWNVEFGYEGAVFESGGCVGGV